MAYSIHMTTEAVRMFVVQNLARLDEIENSGLHLKNKIMRIHWEGKSRDAFVQDANNIIDHMITIVDEGRINLQRVQREIDEWLSVDQQGAQAIATIGTVIGGFVTTIVDFVGDRLEDIFRLWWKTQNNEQRLAYLQKELDKIAKKYGMPTVPVSFEQIEDKNDLDYRGGYDDKKNAISLDIDNINADDPVSILTTLAHESRHAYQKYCIDYYEKNGSVPDGVDTNQVQQWHDNFDNYNDGTDDFEGYWNQIVERDARSSGEQYVKETFLQGDGDFANA